MSIEEGGLTLCVAIQEYWKIYENCVKEKFGALLSRFSNAMKEVKSCRKVENNILIPTEKIVIMMSVNFTLFYKLLFH